MIPTAGCGHHQPGTLAIPQSAFADSSLCTREPSLPFCTGLAQRGSAVWERRHSANPSVGVRRQLPLHKGGPVAGRPYFLCFSAYNRPSAWAQYGSSVTPAPPGARKRSGKNLVFPREVRCPDSHTFFVFVGCFCLGKESLAVPTRDRNNTPPIAKETGPREPSSHGACFFAGLRRSEGSGS